METYFIKKQVDWSVLNQGLSIPVTLQDRVFHIINRDIKRGERIKIDILYGSNIYQVDLVNQAFDENKYSGHASVLQIRYNPGSEICKMLRVVFRTSYDYMGIKNEP
jgi:5-methylcytosine-specific restriction protein A